MGLFNKGKNMFKDDHDSGSNLEQTFNSNEISSTDDLEVKDDLVSREDVQDEVKIYEKGLTKSRQGFVSKLVNLTNKYNKVTDEYFEELEEILIMADIGVNTVMSFIDRLRKRVKHEKIESTEYLKEVIVDELLMMRF